MRACLIAVLLLILPTVAEGRRETGFDYPLSRVWTSAVRLMRVDMRSKVTEKARDDGYFLFEYPMEGRIHGGSFEVFEVVSGGRRHVKVILQINGLPDYVEMMVLDKLKRKLRADFGDPHQPKLEAKPAPATKDDAQSAPKKADDNPGAQASQDKKAK